MPQSEGEQLERAVVVDTSAVMEDARAVFRRDTRIFIPMVVIRQLDGLKKNDEEEVRGKARLASYLIQNASRAGNAKIITSFEIVDGLADRSDNKIVGAALYLKNKFPEADISILTTDRNMQIVSEALGVGLEELTLDNTKAVVKGNLLLRVDWAFFIFFPLIIYGLAQNLPLSRCCSVVLCICTIARTAVWTKDWHYAWACGGHLLGLVVALATTADSFLWSAAVLLWGLTGLFYVVSKLHEYNISIGGEDQDSYRARFGVTKCSDGGSIYSGEPGTFPIRRRR